IYCLMRDKKKNTYINMIYVIKQFEPNLKPKIIKSDFEYASIRAFAESFVDSIINACQFHLGQSIQRKLKELGVSLFYRYNNNFKKFVKCLTFLAYVRIEKIEESYVELLNHPEFSPNLRFLYEYFFNNYINES